MFKRDQSRDVLDEDCPRSECLDESQVFLEQMVAVVLHAPNGSVNGESLAGGASGNQVKIPFPNVKFAHDLDGIQFPDVRSLHQCPRMIPLIGPGVGGHDFRGEKRFKAGHGQSFRKTARSCEQIDHAELVIPHARAFLRHAVDRSSCRWFLR